MSRPHRWLVVGLCCMAAAVGCQEGEPRGSAVDVPHGVQQVVFKPMQELLGLPEPVRVAITRDHIPNFSLVPDLSSMERFIGPLEPAPWAPLQFSMQTHLDRPARFVRSNYRSIRYHMGEGRFQFAMVSATEYAEITRRPVSKIVAVPINTKGEQERCGLFIVRKESKIDGLTDLKGRQLEYGPKGDAVTHWAAVEALKKAGLSEKDLKKSLLPPYNFHINSFEVAKAVLTEGADAGVVDELAFESWPEKSTILTQLSVCKDRFRVIGRTEAVPEGPFIASVKTDPELFAKMQDLLINELKGDERVLGKLHIREFVKADKSMYRPLIDRLGIKPEETSTQPWVDDGKDAIPDPDPAAKPS